MLNKFKIFFLFIVFKLNLSAQAPDRFIQFYNPSPNYNAESYGVAETSYGYMLSGISVDTIGSPLGYWAYTVIGVDFMGNQLFEKKYGNESMSFGSSEFSYDCLKKNFSSYYSTAPIYDYATNEWSSILITMNEFGDTLWTKKYIGDSLDSVRITHAVCKTIDNGFIMTGRTYSNSSSQSKAFILKTDSLGNQEWIQKFNHLVNYEWGNSVIQDSLSKKYIIVGSRGYPVTSYIYITDSLGSVIHQKFFSGIFGGALVGVKQLTDGGIIACGVEATGNTISTWDLMRACLIKFDISGNLIWKKTFGKESILNTFIDLKISAGDTIVVAGQYDSIYTQGLGLNSMFQVYKISSDGDNISRRYIDIHKDNANQDGFKGLTLTSDGGIAMTGMFSMIPSPTPFVLVKLDKWGCDTADCQLVGINEIQKNNFDFTLYPNPANDLINITCSNNANWEYYEIIDVSGKIIATEKINSTNFSINTQQLKQGIYAIRLFDKNKNVSVKRFSIVH